MLRILILASLCAVINASIIPDYVLSYPRSLRRLFGAKRETDAEERTGERDVCKTDECKLIAKLIKESMDESVDPCEDFYQYACGNWSNVNPIPENMTDWSLWRMVSKKVENQVKGIIASEPKSSDLFAVKLAKKWYRSCMDVEAIERRGVEPILSTLWRHGGWPLIMEDGEWDDDVYNWQIVDDHFARLLGFNAFHDVHYSSLYYGENDTIQIDTPHLPLGANQILDFEKYFNTDSSDENNESGEGSQEKGSKERRRPKSDEDEDRDEDEDESDQTEEDEDEDQDDSSKREDSEDWNTAEEDEDDDEEEDEDKRIAVRGKRKRLGHGGAKNRRNKATSRRVVKAGKRTRRETDRQRVKHRALHHLKRKKNGKLQRGSNGKLSNPAHQTHNKLSTKKHNLPRGKARGRSKVKTNRNRNNNKRRKVAASGDEDKEKRMKRKGDGRKDDRRKGHDKRPREKRVEKLNRNGSKLHTSKHQSHSRVSAHRSHHANSISNSRHKKMPLTDDADDVDNENDASDDETNSEVNENNEQSEGNDGDESEQVDKSVDDNEEEDDDEDDDNDDEDSRNDDEDDDEEEEDAEARRLKMKEMYRQHILNVSIILSKGRGIEIPTEQMLQDIDDLIEFIVKLGELTLIDSEPESMTLEGLQEYYEELGPTKGNTKINWVRKIQKLFSEAGVDIEDDVEVTLVNPEYLKQLRALLEQTPSRVIVNYIHWLFVNKAILAGTKELRELSDSWAELFSFESREQECLELVQLTNVAGYEYVKKYFSEDVMKSARDMIDDIQKEVEYQIKESTWMNEDTKHFVLDKLVHMRNMVGYPEWYQNTTIVKHYFRGLTIGPSFYENLLNYIRYARWKSLRAILAADDDDEADDMLDPLELNAFFMPTENSISVTAADFQSPMFAHNRPWYVNFGIIGLVMGHEVNHGFDDSGHLYDKQGNRMEWLSAMAQAYDKRAECFVDQYNEYSIFKGENYTIENYGNQTAGENIADSMGLQAVFRAYKRRERECRRPDPALPGLEKFTNDQNFFLSFANLWCEVSDRESTIRSAKYDVHSTARLRVIGPVSNSQDFARAFNCPVGSPMNPKRKCNIWV